MALIRLAAIIIAIEALFYVLLWVYLRSLRRERLEGEWAEAHPESPGDSPERDDFIRRSMVNFNASLQVRLITLVFVLPTLAIFVIAYFVNRS